MNKSYFFSADLLEAAARVILGLFYEEMADVYLQLYLRCHKFDLQKSDADSSLRVAFITRRSNVLLSIFSAIFCYYATLPPEKQPVFFKETGLTAERIEYLEQTYFITDSALLSMCCQVGDEYLCRCTLPGIVIFDELLLHGRALNNFLLQLETRMTAWVQTHSGQISQQEADQFNKQLLNHIEIQVYMQNNEELLLLARYQQRLFSHRIACLTDVRKLSKRLALLVEISDQNDVAYSWSLRIPYTSQLARRLQTCQPGQAGFSPRLSVIQYHEVLNYLRPYPDAGHPKAICSIRWRQSCLGREEKDNSLMLVPFIMFGKFPLRRLSSLHQAIVQDLSELGLCFLSDLEPYLQGNEAAYARWLTETNELVLNSLIFHQFFKAMGEDTVELHQADLTLMARNYATYSLRGADVCAQMEKLWLWGREHCEDGKFEAYMDLLLAETPPIWSSSENRLDPSLIDLENPQYEWLHTAVEDAIISIADETERHAYDKYHSIIPLEDKVLSNWGRYYSISEVLEKAKENVKEEISASQQISLLALIVHQMDLGIIGMNSIYEDKTYQIYTVTRAGEQAMALEPMRYQTYIPVLLEILNRCNQYQMDLYKEICRFFVDRMGFPSELAEHLYTFTDKVEHYGGGLKSWNQALFQPYRTTLFRRNIERGLTDAHKVDIKKQAWLLDQYSKS